MSVTSLPRTGTTALARLRIVAINDVYELANLPRLQTFLSTLSSSSSSSSSSSTSSSPYLTNRRPSAVVLAGDFLSPSTLSSIDGGRGMVATLKTVGITHVSLGNHEQDMPLPSLEARLRDLTSSTSSTSSTPSPTTAGTSTSSDGTETVKGTIKATTRTQPPPAIVVLNSNIRQDLPNNALWMGSSSSDNDTDNDTTVTADVTKPYSIVTSPCGQVKVALVGLLSDEPGIFRNGTFKGAPIQNVLETYTSLYRQLVLGDDGTNKDDDDNDDINKNNNHRGTVATLSTLTSQKHHPNPIADFILPLTHESMPRDRELARHMLTLMDGPGLILGGHEHEPYNDIVTLDGHHPYSDVDVGGGEGLNHNSNQPSTTKTNTDATGSSSSSSSVRLPPSSQPPTSDRYIQILKSGMDARNAALVDLTFELPSSHPPTDGAVDESPNPHHTIVRQRPRLVQICTELVDLSQYDPSPIAQQVVDKHMSVIQSLEDEVIIDTHDSVTTLPPGTALSSQRTRFQQTTVGGIFCQMIKEEMEVDAALINGASIKGDAVYDDGRMSYAQLKAELPFPTKIVVVTMRRHELQEAVHYSRTAIEDGTDLDRHHGAGPTEVEIPRRGYLQVDTDYDNDGQFGSLDDLLQVALPRNLLSGFCKIAPLMDIGRRLKKEGAFPGDDDFVPAIDLVVRHACKNRWFHIMGGDNQSFRYFDLNNDGVLDRYEIKAMMTTVLGHEPADFVVDDMIASIDKDDNGVIDHGEFSFLLAQMEREQSARKH